MFDGGEARWQVQGRQLRGPIHLHVICDTVSGSTCQYVCVKHCAESCAAVRPEACVDTSGATTALPCMFANSDVLGACFGCNTLLVKIRTHREGSILGM